MHSANVGHLRIFMIRRLMKLYLWLRASVDCVHYDAYATSGRLWQGVPLSLLRIRTFDSSACTYSSWITRILPISDLLFTNLPDAINISYMVYKFLSLQSNKAAYLDGLHTTYSAS